MQMLIHVTQKGRIKPVSLQRKSEQLVPSEPQGKYSFVVPNRARVQNIKTGTSC
jgi:hypothetical protein